MLIITYDISNDKLRIRFSKYLSKFGGRLQYSVFEIRNSDRVLENIITHIKGYFEKKFSQTDSIIIFNLNDRCERINFGYACNDENDLILVG